MPIWIILRIEKMLTDLGTCPHCCWWWCCWTTYTGLGTYPEELDIGTWSLLCQPDSLCLPVQPWSSTASPHRPSRQVSVGQLQQTPDNGNGTFRPSSSPLVLDGWSRRAVRRPTSWFGFDWNVFKISFSRTWRSTYLQSKRSMHARSSSPSTCPFGIANGRNGAWLCL